ncbi:hypothetical protein [Halobacterium noricense]|nr:hypothetical protein [Halobacterium noricense]UHH24238.1 hypothetical protein LT974_09560 [Halobacterium noricense]
MSDEPEILVTNDDTVGPLRGPTSPRTASGSRTVSMRLGFGRSWSPHE